MNVRRTAAKIKNNQARIFLPNTWTYEDLFTQLNNNNINYVVLRWWEKLPNISINSDVDILVADEHKQRIVDITNAKNLSPRAVDVYTVSGIEYSRENVTYYEPEKARDILKSAISDPSGYKIPAPRQAFMALAYHALYHKGFYSELTSQYRSIENGGKFYNALKKQAGELNISVAINMEAIDAYLAEKNWRPPTDKLARLSLRNDWARLHFFDRITTLNPDNKYIGAFILRQECIKHNACDLILQLIKKAGLKIINVQPIADDKITPFAEKMRGGNWKDGGLPAMLVVVKDNNPQIAEHKQTDGSFLDNNKMKCKIAIRQTLDKKYGTRKNSWLHGCDNIYESKEYIQQIAPDLAKSIYK